MIDESKLIKYIDNLDYKMSVEYMSCGVPYGQYDKEYGNFFRGIKEFIDELKEQGNECNMEPLNKIGDNKDEYDLIITEYFKLTEKCNKLEQALDKSCEFIKDNVAMNCYACDFAAKCNRKEDGLCFVDNMTKGQWKEWCIKDE